MNSKFYVEEKEFSLFEWKDRVVRLDSKDFEFFNKSLRSEKIKLKWNIPFFYRFTDPNGIFVESVQYDCIENTIDIPKIGIIPLDDDYWKLNLTFHQRTPVRKKIPAFQKNKPLTNRPILYDVTTQIHFFICDGKDGVIQCFKDYKLI